VEVVFAAGVGEVEQDGFADSSVGQFGVLADFLYPGCRGFSVPVSYS